MTPERHEHLMSHFDKACDLDAAAQAAYVERLAPADPELARELASLLHHDRSAPDAGYALSEQLGGLVRAAAELALASGVTHPATSAPGAAECALGAAGDLEFVAPLAEGGMGRILLARQRSLRREVAVKTLKPEMASPALSAGLLQEAILLGALEHPNIVPVHLLGDDHGRPLLVMKHVEGVSWGRLLADPQHPAWSGFIGPDTERLVAHLSILRSVCNALDYAHSRGIFHRDIKPDNVMVGAFGEVYLVDWGIAVRREDGAVAPPGAEPAPLPQGERRPAGLVGTPSFMAPEMAEGGTVPLSPAADVYLLGATLHYVLTGTPRHPGETLAAVLQAARDSPPHQYGPEVPEELAAICNRATAKDPRERFATVLAFRNAITEYLAHRGSIALSDVAHGRLAQLRARLASLASPLPTTGQAIEGLAMARQMSDLSTECLFACRESLRAWPANPRARSGLRGCLAAMIEYEVGQENLTRSHALLQELQELAAPPTAEEAPSLAALSARVEALRTSLREREARAARQREFERRWDWTVAAHPRTVVLVAMLVFGVLLWRITAYDRRSAPAAWPPHVLALSTGIGLAVISALVGTFRRALFATTVTRHLVLGILCCVGAMFVSRSLHVIPAPATADIVSMDLVLGALGAALGAIVLARWLWMGVPLFVGGALTIRLFPWIGAGVVFTATAMLALTAFLLMTPSRAKRSPERHSGP